VLASLLKSMLGSKPAVAKPAIANPELAGGDDYQVQLARFHEYLRPAVYVEVGIAMGHTFALARPGTEAIGIDPTPNITVPLGAQHRVIKGTSDDFFASPQAEALRGRVELGFIDGMHRLEYALRDFSNLERLARRDSVLLIHDCWPLDAATSARDRTQVFWTGDIWRLVMMLRKYRADLVVRTIAAPPSGLGMVLNLDPTSTLLRDRHDELVAEFLALDYSALQKDKAGQLGRLESRWSSIEPLLQERARR
jgi:hypothetical protein